MKLIVLSTWHMITPDVFGDSNLALFTQKQKTGGRKKTTATRMVAKTTVTMQQM